ncbi:hypothetical protein [Cecembia rubra]|uniref:Uncharacterized protein n=1 Tax=Cecembia rubra TaxID=1485585 RepID=A0A2P8E4Z4_9BACT|nr:hypothetical protein [Cecembia rubra]PSL04532.1 hypothetical protein CLV48_105278 [Cecembia rubra]
MSFSYITMAFSAAILVILGMVYSFFPQEILSELVQEPTPILVLVLQLLGAVYIGFGVMNWMLKNVKIGGIYARPLTLGNFAHFFIGGLSIVRLVIEEEASSFYVFIFLVIYVVFAGMFARLIFS